MSDAELCSFPRPLLRACAQRSRTAILHSTTRWWWVRYGRCYRRLDARFPSVSSMRGCFQVGVGDDNKENCGEFSCVYTILTPFWLKFSGQSVFRSIWFLLSRGSGPAFDGSVARQASVAAAAERESQRCCRSSVCVGFPTLPRRNLSFWMVHGGPMTQKNKGFVSSKERHTKIWEQGTRH